MKVLILAHSFPQNDTDYRGRFILDYVKLNKDCEFHIIAPHYERSFETEINGAKVHYFEWKHGYLAGRKLYNPVTLFVTLKMIWKFYFSSKMVLRSGDFDGVFACWAVPAGFVAYFLKKFRNIRYDVWLLGTDVNKFINIPFFLPAILKNAGNVYSNSNDLALKIKNKYEKIEIAILPTRSTLPEPSMPENPYPVSKSSLNVFFVGRLEKIKGIDLFIDIAEKVKEKRQAVTFFVIGDGSMTKIVEAAQEKGSIIWLGRLTPSEISYYADFMDILCITSRNESMPVVYWELADKTRILSFPVGDIPKYLPKDNICQSIENFAQKIIVQA